MLGAALLAVLVGCTSTDAPKQRNSPSRAALPPSPSPTASVELLKPLPDCKQFNARISQLIWKADGANGGPGRANRADSLTGGCNLSGTLKAAGGLRGLIFVSYGRNAAVSGSTAEEYAGSSMKSSVEERCTGKTRGLGWSYALSLACGSTGAKVRESAGISDRGNWATVEISVWDDRPRDADSLRKEIAPDAQQLVRDVFAQL
jgi:hypothetical protein